MVRILAVFVAVHFRDFEDEVIVFKISKMDCDNFGRHLAARLQPFEFVFRTYRLSMKASLNMMKLVSWPNCERIQIKTNFGLCLFYFLLRALLRALPWALPRMLSRVLPQRRREQSTMGNAQS
jgi:hypothetical protein